MNKILILGGTEDMHTLMVVWGLRQKGCENPTVWSWYDFPRHSTSSIEFETNGAPHVSIDQDSSVSSPFDVIWYRRPGSPIAASTIHSADKTFVETEAQEYLQNALTMLGTSETLWINHPVSARAANSKALQLIKAQEIGLRVPESIFTNNPQKVSEFYRRFDGHVVYKPFRPAEWRSEKDGINEKFVLPATILPAAHVEDRAAIAACPGIYQRRIKAKYEARITIIGERVIACKILSQETSDLVDWRHDLNLGKVGLELYTLPSDISAQCLRLCKVLNLSFGSMDFIIDENDEYVFIEVNEAGQFLWMDEIVPGIGLLDTFCDFLIGSKGSENSSIITCIDYRKSEQFKIDYEAMSNIYKVNKRLRDKARVYYE